MIFNDNRGDTPVISFSIHPHTAVCSERISNDFSLFHEEQYAEGKLLPGQSIDWHNLVKIKRFLGEYITPEELLAYHLSLCHSPNMHRAPEHHYYITTLGDTPFVRLWHGDYIKGAGRHCMPLVELYFMKYPGRTHSDFYLDLHHNYHKLNDLMPGFNTWLSDYNLLCSKYTTINYFTYWYGGCDNNYWGNLKPQQRIKKLPYEPDCEWIFNEDKCPTVELNDYVKTKKPTEATEASNG